MKSNPAQNIRGSRLNEHDRQVMLDKLDAQEAANKDNNKRVSARIAYRKNDIAIRIYHPGGSTSACLVSTRNLSAGGVSFIYDGFLHRGTKVELVLKRRVAGTDVIRGTVQHCALVVKTVHLIGIKFENQIFPKLYIDPSAWGELEDGGVTDASKLTGTVLHLDDQEMDRLLMSHFLKGTQIKLISTKTTEEALAALQTNTVDCVLCDLTLDNATGEDAIHKFRDSGYSGPIAVVTAENSAQRLLQLDRAGANALLGKPFDSAKLTSLLSTWLGSSESTTDPIISTHTADANMRPLIEQYVVKLQALRNELRKHMNDRNLPAIRNVCLVIKGTAGGFGFTRISDLARDAVVCIDSSADITMSLPQVQLLEAACARAKAA